MSWASELLSGIGATTHTLAYAGPTAYVDGRAVQSANTTVDIVASIQSLDAGSEELKLLPQGKRSLGAVAIYHAGSIETDGPNGPPKLTWRGKTYEVVMSAPVPDFDDPDNEAADANMSIAVRVKQ